MDGEPLQMVFFDDPVKGVADGARHLLHRGCRRRRHRNHVGNEHCQILDDVQQIQLGRELFRERRRIAQRDLRKLTEIRGYQNAMQFNHVSVGSGQ